MTRFLSSLLIAVSMLLAPIAHVAMAEGAAASNYAEPENVKEQVTAKDICDKAAGNHADSGASNSDHCCCAHLVAIDTHIALPGEPTVSSTHISASSEISPISRETLLEPPHSI